MVADTSCQTDPRTVADMSQFTPGAAAIRCQPWDIGTGVTGYVWKARNPKATLLLMHGYGDYAQRYVQQNNQLIPHLLNMGVSVYAFDMWGAGRSPGPRGASDNDDAVQDHLAARRKITQEAGDLPLYLFAHSNGGLVTVTSVLNDQNNLNGVILMAPGLLYDVSPFLRGVAQVGGFLFPTLHPPLGDGDFSELTRDPEALRQILEDPLMVLDGVTWAVTADGARLSHENWNLYSQIGVPVLAVHGTGDVATDPDGSRRFIDRISSEDKTFVPVEGAYHAILDDTDRDETRRVILDWLRNRISRF